MTQTEIDTNEVKVLVEQIAPIVRAYLIDRIGKPEVAHNFTALNALAIVSASVLGSAPKDEMENLIEWYMTALRNQIGDFQTMETAP